LTWLNQPSRGIIGNLPVWAEFELSDALLESESEGLAGKIRPGNSGKAPQ